MSFILAFSFALFLLLPFADDFLLPVLTFSVIVSGACRRECSACWSLPQLSPGANHELRRSACWATAVRALVLH
jgi:hypothetical protein